MSLDQTALNELAEQLSVWPAIREKAEISNAYQPAQELAKGVALGDDCAAIPDASSGGHLLFAAEGMLNSFVQRDPWFAGYCAVMVNLSDIAAMGGRPIAITNVLWTGGSEIHEEVWKGLKAASLSYDVPIVGGHTSQGEGGLAAAVVGRAGRRLITSFDAKPGDALVVAIDMAGEYRRDQPFWNASTSTEPRRLREELDLLPGLAEKGICCAGKDISNGGIVGTLAMLCECSGVGAEIQLDDLPIPDGVGWFKWMISFPSYGYLLAVSERKLNAVEEHFSESGVTCSKVGVFSETRGIHLVSGASSAMVVLG